LNDNNFERVSASPEPEGYGKFVLNDANSDFRKSRFSYITLFVLMVGWPVLSLAAGGDPSEGLRLATISRIFIIYLPTIVMQWVLFGLIYTAAYFENTGLRGLGFTRLRLIHFLWAIAFLLVSNLTLTLIALLLAKIGISIPGDIELLLPTTGTERIFWIILSITAGVVEETVLRGYLITRLQIFGKTTKWLLPGIISSVIFGIGHTYQGLGGFILLSIFGGMFAILYWKTRSLWPAIIAHTFQDISALFFPFQ
jgi:membrane protease YdiL (CAAX protease family)